MLVGPKSVMPVPCWHWELCRIGPIHFLAGIRWMLVVAKSGLIRLVCFLLGFVCVVEY